MSYAGLVSHRGQRHLGAAALVSVVLATLAGSSLAEGDAALPRYQIDGRIAFGIGLQSIGFLAQMDAAYRVLPFLLVGGYIEHPVLWGALGYNDVPCPYERSCPATYWAFGPRVELQPPGWIVAPWIGAGLGLDILEGSYSNTIKPAALETTVDAGIEVRPSRVWGIGAYIAWKVLLTDPNEVDSNYGYSTPTVKSLGLRIAGRF